MLVAFASGLACVDVETGKRTEITKIELEMPTTRLSNGIAFSPDGSLMYFADTPTKRIDVFDYDIATGTPSDRRAFVELGAVSGYSDGSTVDSEGCLWNAEWGGS